VTLIVVSGAPGTGKSTIATALGAALRFPVLSLDPIKEALADVLGLGGEDWSNQVGDGAAEVVFRLAAAFPDAVTEGWWRGERRNRALGEFAGATRGVLPLRLGAGLIEVDTGPPDAAESAVTAVRSALSL
jgi:predicted kinase